MKSHYPKLFFSLLLTLFFLASNAQVKEVIWSTNPITKSNEENIIFYKTKPKHSTILNLSIENLNARLANIPKRGTSQNHEGVILKFPNQAGKLDSYLVQEASVMEPELQAQFPEIRSFVGKGLDNPAAILRFSLSPQKGFSGMVLSDRKTVFIEPYTEDLRTYISFINTNEDGPRSEFICETEYEPSNYNITDEEFLAMRNANDGTLRTYRLALACTGEYAQFHGGTTAGALAAMNTTMTRVNGVYERDLALTMVLIANNTNVIFLDGTTDPYTNNNGGAMLSQNQATLDNAGSPIFIGTANYDIGHVFSTGGGGIATLRSPCVNGSKARGVTGQNAPVGDTFDIDYVAHEIGHQFGGNHTQNNNCQRSFVSVEPGSASTIMGYAGICFPNVQNNSDDYFHGENIKEMWANISSGPGSNCFNGSATNNTAPNVDAGSDYTIPVSTAFVLKGNATDADTTSGLTYCWEQTDNESGIMPPQSTNNFGPMFRSLDPSSSPDRYMPPLSTVMSGSLATTWEVVPSIGRTMNFTLIVRDNEANGGATGSDDVVVTTQDGTPFAVNTPTSWPANSSQDVTWTVGQTDVLPINCQTVNILFTTNNGFNFTTLATGVANTGSATITAPNIPNTNNAKILVEAADNIFYAVSNAFSITDALSVEEYSIDNLSVYPNPNGGSFNIGFDSRSGEAIAIEVFDIRGRAIYSKSYASVSRFETRVTLNNVQSGVYLLNIKDGSSKVTKKIVVD